MHEWKEEWIEIPTLLQVTCIMNAATYPIGNETFAPYSVTWYNPYSDNFTLPWEKMHSFNLV